MSSHLLVHTFILHDSFFLNSLLYSFNTCTSYMLGVCGRESVGEGEKRYCYVQVSNPAAQETKLRISGQLCLRKIYTFIVWN